MNLEDILDLDSRKERLREWKASSEKEPITSARWAEMLEDYSDEQYREMLADFTARGIVVDPVQFAEFRIRGGSVAPKLSDIPAQSSPTPMSFGARVAELRARRHHEPQGFRAHAPVASEEAGPMQHMGIAPASPVPDHSAVVRRYERDRPELMRRLGFSVPDATPEEAAEEAEQKAKSDAFLRAAYEEANRQAALREGISPEQRKELLAAAFKEELEVVRAYLRSVGELGKGEEEPASPGPKH